MAKTPTARKMARKTAKKTAIPKPLTAAPSPLSTGSAPAPAAPVVPVRVRGSKVPGVLDSRLHPTLHEAHRVLSTATDAWEKALANIEGQFVRPLLNAHDGDDDTSMEIKAQIAAFRELYQ